MRISLKDTSTLLYIEKALNYIKVNGKKSEQVFACSMWRNLQSNQALTAKQISYVTFVQDKIRGRLTSQK